VLAKSLTSPSFEVQRDDPIRGPLALQAALWRFGVRGLTGLQASLQRSSSVFTAAFRTLRLLASTVAPRRQAGVRPLPHTSY